MGCTHRFGIAPFQGLLRSVAPSVRWVQVGFGDGVWLCDWWLLVLRLHFDSTSTGSVYWFGVSVRFTTSGLLVTLRLET